VIFLISTLVILGASAEDVEVEAYAETIVIEGDMAEASSGILQYGQYEVEFESLHGELSSQSLVLTGTTASSEEWGWRVWADRLALEQGVLSGSDVVVSRCVADWRPWELRADRAVLRDDRVALGGARLSIMDLVEVHVPLDSLSLTPSSWSVGIPTFDWIDQSARLSVPFWFRIDEVRSAKVALGWWQGARLSGELVDEANGVISTDLALRDDELSGYVSADYAAGDRDLGVLGEGALVFGNADLTWFDEYELRSRDFLEHRAMIVSHGFSLERFGWLLGADQSEVHSLAFTGEQSLGNLGFERHRVRLYHDGVNTGVDGVLALSASERVGVLELDAELFGLGQLDDISSENEPELDLDGDVTLSLPFWARHGEIIHEASVGVRVDADSQIAPSIASRFYGAGSQSVEIWAPITDDGVEFAGAVSHRNGGWFADLSGELAAETFSAGGAFGFTSDSFELTMAGWIDDKMVAGIGTGSLFVPSPHGRWRPSLSSIVSDEGLLFIEAGLGWIADCGCLDVEVTVSSAEDRTMPVVGGVVRLESIY
jgi:hypothetical protein